MSRIMTGFFLFLFLFIMSGIAEPPQNYGLIWSDEFDGSELDLDTWTYDVGGWGWGNNEWQYYTDGANMTIEDGSAILHARQESFGGKQYTSCRIVTQVSFGETMQQSGDPNYFRYGYVETRLKAPMGQGMWPAFWTLGMDFPPYNGYYTPAVPAPWCNCGEIELYETKTGDPGYGGMGDNTFIATCHYSGAGGGTIYNSGKYTHDEYVGLQYHLFALLWDEQSVRFFFDDEQFWQHDITASYQSELHQSHFLLANIAIGGDYQGHNVSSSSFPAEMGLDYIRWYQEGVNVKDEKNAHRLPEATLVDPKKAMCRIFDMKGRLVADYTDRIRALNVGDNIMGTLSPDLSTGAYIIKLHDGVNALTKRVVVAH